MPKPALHQFDNKKKPTIAQRTLKQTKQNSWQKYTSSITSSTPANEVWKNIRAIEKKSLHLFSFRLVLNNNFLQTSL